MNYFKQMFDGKHRVGLIIIKRAVQPSLLVQHKTLRSMLSQQI